jgi:hypothetical protein
MDANRKKALDAALSQIERQFGKGAVMRMGDQPREAIPAVSTGSLGLDIALGIGGLPYGRIVEIYGPESSGKTTLTLQVIAEAQKQGKTCAFVDAEHALDPIYAEKLGVDVDSLLVSQPEEEGPEQLRIGGQQIEHTPRQCHDAHQYTGQQRTQERAVHMAPGGCDTLLQQDAHCLRPTTMQRSDQLFVDAGHERDRPSRDTGHGIRSPHHHPLSGEDQVVLPPALSLP